MDVPSALRSGHQGAASKKMWETRRTINAPASTVWGLITDTQSWPLWGPSVRAVDCATRFVDSTAQGRVQTSLGVWLPFRITGWEPDVSWHWIVAGVPATGHRVIPRGPDSCEIVFTVPGWAPFYLPVCRTAINRVDQLASLAARQDR